MSDRGAAKHGPDDGLLKELEEEAVAKAKSVLARLDDAAVLETWRKEHA
jgi:hypothetical protein